jgi:phosphoglycerol transferase MdoB-like AlkP superfamily enzyme
MLWLSALFVFLTVYALSYASFLKTINRDEPLYFADLSMFGKITGFLDGGMFYPTVHTAIALVVGLAAATSVFVFAKVKTNGKRRLVTLAISVVSISALLLLGFLAPLDAEAKETGFILAFMSEPLQHDNTRDKQDDEPPSAHNPSAPGIVTSEPTQASPNVIVILSESFWDPHQIANFPLSADPIPNFRGLSETAISGYLLSSTYGGGTDNVELSVLTGFSKRLMGLRGTAYETWLLDDPATSLARLFKEKGYETCAIHTYRKDFYSREEAFPVLGFDTFIGIEDMDITDRKGRYVDDKDLTKYILEAYEDIAGRGNPAFIFGISMQNHQPYGGRYETNPISVLDGDMPEDLKDTIECYLHGLNDADIELGRIVDYFKGVDEPTVVLFFGDHQPGLGSSFALYTHTGNMDDPKNRTLEELHSILRTPFLIWSNYKEDRGTVADIDSTLLGNLLLDYIGMEKPAFYHFLDTLSEHVRFFSRMDLFYVDGSGAVRAPDDMSDETAALLEEYRRLVTEITG